MAEETDGIVAGVTVVILKVFGPLVFKTTIECHLSIAVHII